MSIVPLLSNPGLEHNCLIVEYIEFLSNQGAQMTPLTHTPLATHAHTVVGAWISRKELFLPPPTEIPNFAWLDPPYHTSQALSGMRTLLRGWADHDGVCRSNISILSHNSYPWRKLPLGCCYCPRVHWDQNAAAFLAAPSHCKPGNREVKDEMVLSRVREINQDMIQFWEIHV